MAILTIASTLLAYYGSQGQWLNDSNGAKEVWYTDASKDTILYTPALALCNIQIYLPPSSGHRNQLPCKLVVKPNN